jgi:hypothetical protein
MLATRYDKRALNFVSGLCFAAMLAYRLSPNSVRSGP